MSIRRALAAASECPRASLAGAARGGGTLGELGAQNPAQQGEIQRFLIRALSRFLCRALSRFLSRLLSRALIRVLSWSLGRFRARCQHWQWGCALGWGMATEEGWELQDDPAPPSLEIGVVTPQSVHGSSGIV